MGARKRWPDVLYHYTSWVAFKGMLDSRSIRLSGQWNLNDSNEGRVFERVIKAYAGQKSESAADAVLKKLKQHAAYIFCLSQHGDLLSQWRGYAADGKGVSIGFRSESLIRLISGSTKCLLLPVIYVDDSYEPAPDQKRLFDAVLTSTGEPTPEAVMTVAKEMWRYKDHSFSEEREYRLIFNTSDELETVANIATDVHAAVGFRSAEEGLREYFALDLDTQWENLLAEVTVGPRSDADIGVVRRLVRSEELRNVNINRSAIPYR